MRKLLLPLLFVSLLSPVLTSCFGELEPEYEDLLVGTWLTEDGATIIFGENGSYTAIPAGSSSTYQGTYSVDDRLVTIVFSPEEYKEITIVSIDDDTCKLNDRGYEETMTRQ